MDSLRMNRLACQIEALQRISTLDWYPADALEFDRSMPGPRKIHTLPRPDQVREMAKGVSNPYTLTELETLQRRVLALENMAHRNSPQNIQKIIRDRMRGKPSIFR